MNKLKKIYENTSMVNYYDELTLFMDVINSEKIIFEKYINMNSRILDIGCGTGRTTIYLYEKGFRDIVGVDISQNMINRAKKNNKQISFYSSDIKNFHDENLYDVAIFSFNGLMLIKTYKERVEVCKHIYDLLNRCGVFIFTTPFLDNKYFKESWKDRLYEYKDSPNWEYGDIYMDDLDVEEIYIHMPFKKEINEMLSKVGFKVEKTYKRLDLCKESDEIEEHLDDNIYWIARKE